jgi:gamma-glutamylputrescine oxidase
MRQRMVATFPQLAGCEGRLRLGRLRRHLDEPRARLRPASARNVYYLQGFSGHGLALTGLAGRLVAEAMTGDASRFDVFRAPEAPALPRRPAAAHAGAGAGHGLVPPARYAR